jgi:hypothetical protein
VHASNAGADAGMGTLSDAGYLWVPPDHIGPAVALYAAAGQAGSQLRSWE